MPIGSAVVGATERPTGPPGGAIVAGSRPAGRIGALNVAAQATSDGAGNAAFAFDPTPLDQVWTGTLYASTAGSYKVAASVVQWGSFGGIAPYGDVQARGGQRLTVTATGLPPNTVVSLTWLGRVGDPSTPPVNPSSLPSQVTVLNGDITATIAGPVTVSGTVSIGNTPSVAISGTPTVNIAANQVVEVTNTSGGSVTVAGTVTIGNTPAVTITGTPTVNIAANQVVQVTNTSGGSVTVAGTVAISGTPSVTISGTPSVSISSGSVSIASGTVVVSSVTSAVAVRQAVDLLDSTLLAFSSTMHNRVAPTSSLNPYAGILVILAATSNVQPSVAVAVQVVNSTKGINSGWQSVPFVPATGAANAQSPELIFPVPADVGDVIQINYVSNGAGGNLQTSIFGLAACPPLALRPDGRLKALGGSYANNAAGAATVNLIAAPSNASFLVMLKRLNIECGIASAAGNGLVTVQGVPFGGGNLNLLLCFSSPTAPGAAEADYGDGILLVGPVTILAGSNVTLNNVHGVFDYVM